MKRLPGVPGPGEDETPANIQVEAESIPVPDGEMPGQRGDRPASVGLAQQEMDRAEAIERDLLTAPRRIGTESQPVPVLWCEEIVAERSRDADAENVPHEAIVDPAQENAGSPFDLW